MFYSDSEVMITKYDVFAPIFQNYKLNINGARMAKQIIQTVDAPQAIGTYSQAVRVNGGDTIYLSGQIGLDPLTMQMV